MERSYDSIHLERNNYISKKRFKEFTNTSGEYQYNKKERCDKIIKFNNRNKLSSNLCKPNDYYNTNYINNNNYYSKNIYNGYYKTINKKKINKKTFAKNYGEGVRNLSNCEIIPSQSSPLNENMEENSSKNTDSTNYKSHKEKYNQFNNTKESQKFVSYFITEKSQFFHPIIMNNKQLNLNNNQKDYYDLSFSNINHKHKEIINPDNIIHINEENEKIYTKNTELQKILPQLSNYEYELFNKSLIKVEKNPIEDINIYPQKLFSFNDNIITKHKLIKTNINNEKNCISIESCYLLAKIPNWRLVSKFVPIQNLILENFKTIFEKSKEKSRKINGEKKINLIYSEKYEELVENLLEKNRNKKKEINKDIFNMKRIIDQYQYDILNLKNKINQKKFELNYLNVKNEELSKGVK